MKWNKTLVTVKRLHKQPAGDSTVDMLIRENDYMARLRHPNILLLMGLCQTNNLEGLVLIYERIGCGSLFHCLHQKSESLSRFSMCELLLQVSDALLYVHQQNLLHCALTSHAIQLVTPSVAKLNNFEYMVEKDLTEYAFGNDQSEGVSSRSFSIVEEQIQHGPYNWLAPEILGGAGPTEKSDLYSLCAIMWEIIHGNIPWGELVGPQIKMELVERKGVLKVSEKVKNPFNVLLHYGLSSEPDDRNLTVEQFRDIMAQIVMDHERSATVHEHSSPRTTRTYKSYKSWKAPKSSKMDNAPTTDDDTGLSGQEEKENPFIDFVQDDGTAKTTPAGKGKTSDKNADRISKMSISAAIGSRTTVKTSGNPLWREKIDIIRQSQIPSGGYIQADLSTDDDVHDRKPGPPITSVRTLGGTMSAGGGSARHHTDLKHIRDELERSKRSFFESPGSGTWPSTSSLPPSKLATAATSEPRAAKTETVSVGRMASVNENNNRSQLGNKSSTSMEVSETEVNPFKLYHTENVIAEIKAVLATRPINKYKSTSTFLPSSLNRTCTSRGSGGELLKQTVYGALSNPVAKYVRAHRFTTSSSHVDSDHTTVTTKTSHMRSHITPMSRFSMTPSSRGSAAIAGNTSDFNRSSWSGSWTLSFDNNEDHSCKPASHCLLRESTPINTKDSNSLPKPPDFAWPQSQQSSASKLVTPPIMRWSRSKTTQLSPAVKKALSYYGSTQQQKKHSLGSGSCNPDNTAPLVEAEAGDLGVLHYGKGLSPQSTKKREWNSGRSVKDLIRKFQGHVEEHVRKQSSHCSRKRSQNKFPNVGVFSTKSTPAVRTRDYSAFCSTEYHRPTPLVNSAMTSTTSYLQKIVRKSTERLSGIMHRAQRQDCSAAESPVLLKHSPSPPPRPPPPTHHVSSYLSSSTEGSELTPSDEVIITTEDDSEDVSVLVDKVIHNAHKQVTVEARTVQERVSQASQSIQGSMAAPAAALPIGTSSDPSIRSNYSAGVRRMTDNLTAADAVRATSTALHRSTAVCSQQCQSEGTTATYTTRQTMMSNLGTQTVSGTQTTGAGYFSASVRTSGACQHCHTQRFSNVNRQASRCIAATAMARDIKYDDEPTSVQSTEVSSRRVDAELEDLYFDDELCTENICRQRHLRLQSPSADTSVMPSGGAIGGTPTMTVKACSGARLQAEATGQRSSVTESEMRHQKTAEDEPRSSLPPLMEVDSDESEFLRKVLSPNSDIGYYATVRVDSFDKNSPLMIDSKASNRRHQTFGDTAVSPEDQSDQTCDSNTDDALDA